MSEIKGITIGELKTFLSRLPIKYDDFGLVNGSVVKFNDLSYAKIENPIINLEIDEEMGDLLFLHQSEEELNEILKEIQHGNSTATDV